MDTVDLMQTYSSQYLEVTCKVLKKMKKNDLLESSSDTGSKPRGELHNVIHSLWFYE